jgi:hypothetical protein
VSRFQIDRKRSKLRGINPVPYRAVFGETWVQRHAG